MNGLYSQPVRKNPFTLRQAQGERIFPNLMAVTVTLRNVTAQTAALKPKAFQAAAAHTAA
jgi:hypothetical protein